MILLLLCILGAFMLGYYTCTVAAVLTERRARNLNDFDHAVPDVFDGPLWVDRHPHGSRAELVQRAMDLEKARHEVE